MHCISLPRAAAIAAIALALTPAARAEESGAEPAAAELTRSDALPEPTGVLRLADALAAALARSPELAAESHALRAREAALVQAGAFANPTLEVDLEDFAGSGDFSGAKSAQTTLLLGQKIELGGKRAARLAVAEAERDSSKWDYEVRRIDVLARTADAFVDVLVAQERHELRGEALELARSMQRVAGLRLRSGVASPAEEIRAGVQVEIAGVELEHSEHELATARQELAAHWAGESARFERANGELETTPPIPSEAELAEQLRASPHVARWQSELARRDALRDRARSSRIPDPTLRAGVRHLAAPDDAALVVGVELPLPLWDRRRAAVRETEARAAESAARARAAQVRAITEIATARTALVAAAEEAELLRERVIPGTERAVETLRRGYERGRFAQIEVIDAERARLAAREQYLEALSEAHHSARRIESLTGVAMEARR
jgi:cobalt-zinc-cadmium efflux system outer membrane protein